MRDLLRVNKKFEISLPESSGVSLLCAQTWCGHIGRHIVSLIPRRSLTLPQKIRALHILRHRLHRDLQLHLDTGQHQHCSLHRCRQGVRRRERRRPMLVDQDRRAPFAMARQRQPQRSHMHIAMRATARLARCRLRRWRNTDMGCT